MTANRDASRLLREALRRLVMTSLRPLESRLVARENHVPPPCFIVGPPRSGTTLVYELLVRRFRVAYLSNLAHRFYEAPVAATLVGRPLVTRWRGRFESSYGHIAGWGAPSEGGWIWNRWMPEAHPLAAAHARSLPLHEIRGSVAGLIRVLDGPFLNKNVMHSVHIPLLAEVFPGCGFIQVMRDPTANVRSIVRARLAEAGPRSLNGWWSVKPRSWRAYVDASPAVQAAAQVHFVHRTIEEDAAALAPHQRMVLPYEGVCRDPRGAAEDVAGFLAGLGAPAAVRDEIPQAFSAREDHPLQADVEKDLAGAVERFWERP